MAKNEARLGMDITDFERKLTKATNELNKFARGGAGSLGNLGNAIGAMTGKGSSDIMNLAGSVANLAGAFGLTASAVSIVGDSIRTAMDFEKSMSSLKSLTGLGDTEMQQLKDAAIEMGSTTTQSASQVADAFKLIGSAKPELLGDVDALQEVTKQAILLAEASGMDVPTAAAALTTSLNQMGAGAEEAARFVNVLSAGSQKGAGDINWLNEAITQSGTAAKAVGTGYEELVANLEQLAQAGFQAGASGTAMRSIIMSLEKQGNDKLKPSVVGMTAAFKNLGTECKTLTDYQKLLGKEMAAQGKVLADNATKAANLTTEITGTNTAEEQAKTNTDNFSGSVTHLSNAWKGLMLTINSSNGPLKSAVKMLTDAVDAIEELIGGTEGAEKKAAKSWFKNQYKDVIDSDAEFYANSGLGEDAIRKNLKQTIDSLNTAKGDNEQQKREYEMAYQMAIDYIDEIIKKRKEAENTPIVPQDITAGTTDAQIGKNAPKILPEGSIARLKQQIQEAEQSVAEAVGVDAQMQAQSVVDELKRKLEETECILKIQLESENYDPIKDFEDSRSKRAASVTVSDEPIVQEQPNLFSDGNFDNLRKMRSEIAATKKDILDSSLDMASGIVSLGDTIANLGNTFDSCTTAWDYFSSTIKTAISITDGIIGAIETVNTLTELSALLKTEEAAATGLSTTAKIEDAAASGTNAAAEVTESAVSGATTTAKVVEANAHMESAAAKFFDAHSWIPFAGVALAGAAVGAMVASLSSLPKFAEGAYADRPTLGIFGEAGPELVLPEKKLDEAFERNQGTTNGRVEFVLQNNTLRGWLEQTEKKQSRKV